MIYCRVIKFKLLVQAGVHSIVIIPKAYLHVISLIFGLKVRELFITFRHKFNNTLNDPYVINGGVYILILCRR